MVSLGANGSSHPLKRFFELVARSATLEPEITFNMLKMGKHLSHRTKDITIPDLVNDRAVLITRTASLALRMDEDRKAARQVST